VQISDEVVTGSTDQLQLIAQVASIPPEKRWVDTRSLQMKSFDDDILADSAICDAFVKRRDPTPSSALPDVDTRLIEFRAFQPFITSLVDDIRSTKSIVTDNKSFRCHAANKSVTRCQSVRRRRRRKGRLSSQPTVDSGTDSDSDSISTVSPCAKVTRQADYIFPTTETFQEHTEYDQEDGLFVDPIIPIRLLQGHGTDGVYEPSYDLFRSLLDFISSRAASHYTDGGKDFSQASLSSVPPMTPSMKGVSGIRNNGFNFQDISNFLPPVALTHTMMRALIDNPAAALLKLHVISKILDGWIETFSPIAVESRSALVVSKSHSQVLAASAGFADGKTYRHFVHAVSDLVTLRFLLHFEKSRCFQLVHRKEICGRNGGIAMANYFSWHSYRKFKLCQFKYLPFSLRFQNYNGGGDEPASSEAEICSFLQKFGAYVNIDIALSLCLAGNRMDGARELLQVAVKQGSLEAASKCLMGFLTSTVAMKSDAYFFSDTQKSERLRFENRPVLEFSCEALFETVSRAVGKEFNMFFALFITHLPILFVKFRRIAQMISVQLFPYLSAKTAVLLQLEAVDNQGAHINKTYRTYYRSEAYEYYRLLMEDGHSLDLLMKLRTSDGGSVVVDFLRARIEAASEANDIVFPALPSSMIATLSHLLFSDMAALAEALKLLFESGDFITALSLCAACLSSLNVDGVKLALQRPQVSFPCTIPELEVSSPWLDVAESLSVTSHINFTVFLTTEADGILNRCGMLATLSLRVLIVSLGSTAADEKGCLDTALDLLFKSILLFSLSCLRNGGRCNNIHWLICQCAQSFDRSLVFIAQLVEAKSSATDRQNSFNWTKQFKHVAAVEFDLISACVLGRGQPLTTSDGKYANSNAFLVDLLLTLSFFSEYGDSSILFCPDT
jgi:hypothetical protein